MRSHSTSQVADPRADEGDGAVTRCKRLEPRHQALFQALLSRRALSDLDGDLLWKRVLKAVDAEDELPRVNDSYADACQAINDAVAGLGLAIRQCVDQWTGRAWRALVNVESDVLAEKATDYSANEIAFFRHLVRRIVTARNLAYSISLHDAIRCGNDRDMDPKVKRTDAQKLVAAFVNRGASARVWQR